MKGGSSRIFWYILLGAAAAVVIQYVGFQYQGGVPSPIATGTPRPSGGKAPAKTATPVAAPSGYSAAVAQYQDKRIQFDMYCHADPSSQNYKNGTAIMLDNRSGDARIITVGGVQHSLSGYGWKIITLSAKTLPSTLSVGCGSAVNVGTITLQP